MWGLTFFRHYSDLTPPRPNIAYVAPVRAKRPCMICFRNIILNYDPAAGALTAFRCRFASTPTGKCELCDARRKAWHFPAEGIQGDSLDLQALPDWDTFYFDVDRDANGTPILDADGDEMHEHEDDFREETCSAVFRLCTAFEAVGKTERTVLSKTGAKKKKNKVDYPAWFAARRALMQVYNPRPVANANDAQIAS
ncbi:hypothetical protein DL770_005846 [Monosporascus sp. CRB-9-2]|nr:hypothetical protein DL770_005846 [Monosporascus sp. CRB-9-2]